MRSSPAKPENRSVDVSKSRAAEKKTLSCFTPELSRNPSVVCHDGRSDSRHPPPNVPLFQFALARAVPKEPAPSWRSSDGEREGSRLWKLTEPAKDAAPTVDVPTPRWICTLATLPVRFAKSAV